MSEKSFLSQYGGWLFCCLFFLYLAGGVYFTIAIESVFNGGFFFSVQILWLPLAILIFGLTWFYRQSLYQQTKSSWKVWGTAVAAYPVLILMTSSYVMAVNAATSRGEKITYRGPVQKKWRFHNYRGDDLRIDLLDLSTSEVVRLSVSPSEYAAFNEGDVVVTEFIRGGFGIPYRWRFSSQREGLKLSE